MTKTHTITTALAFLTFLGTAGAATAGHHPDGTDMRKVKYLAHELYEGARYLEEQSREYAYYPGRRERDSLYALRELAEQAHHFYEQVGRYYRDPVHTEHDFRRLARAYREASYGFHYLAAYDHYHEEFRCLRETMDKLAYYYGGYDVYEAPRQVDRYRYERYRKYGKYHRIAHGVATILDAIDDDHRPR